MNTGLAQLVALTAHGNVSLHTRGHRSGLETSSLFRHVGQLSFGIGDTPRDDDAATVTEWFTQLGTRGIRRLYLIRLSPEPDATLRGYDRSAFANGEQAAIVALHRHVDLDIWVPKWTSVEHDGKHAWVLRYCGYIGGEWSDALRGRSVAEVTTALQARLQEIASFVATNGLERWVDNFTGAAALLKPDAEQYNVDLLPEAGYSPEARRLLTAAMSGWVFGGMGSWNDTGPDQAEQYPRYEELTQQLYDTIMDALIAAANAFTPA